MKTIVATGLGRLGFGRGVKARVITARSITSDLLVVLLLHVAILFRISGARADASSTSSLNKT